MKLVPRAKLDEEPLLRALGPEPLGNAFDAAMLARACAGKKTSLKAALLDQRVVAGLGNIYVCEALHRAHLSPKRASLDHRDANRRAARTGSGARRGDQAGAERRDQGRRLVAARPSPDRRANSGCFSTISASTIAKARRCPTPGCKGTIKRIVQTGRSTFFCPVCQK